MRSTYAENNMMNIKTRNFCPVLSRDEDPDPVIFGPPDPDPAIFSTDPDPTCNNGFIKLFLS